MLVLHSVKVDDYFFSELLNESLTKGWLPCFTLCQLYSFVCYIFIFSFFFLDFSVYFYFFLIIKDDNGDACQLYNLLISLLQWVDCISQLLRMYPFAFEFSSVGSFSNPLVSVAKSLERFYSFMLSCWRADLFFF